MKKYYNVSFEYAEGIYCTNIAHAENRADVEREYSVYTWVKITEADEYDVDGAKRHGMPIIEIEATEAAQSEETAQTTENNTPDNTNTPTAGTETTIDTITESADSAEREDKTMTDRKTTIGLQALMLTAYERYGSVGMSEYKEMLIDELDIDKDMISDYNEYRIENGYEPYMVYDELCEQLEGCDPSSIIKMVYFGGMRFNDDFFYFNGYGNISSCTDYEIIKEMKEDKEFLTWYLENSADVEEIDEEEAQEVINECNKMIAQGY